MRAINIIVGAIVLAVIAAVVFPVGCSSSQKPADQSQLAEKKQELAGLQQQLAVQKQTMQLLAVKQQGQPAQTETTDDQGPARLAPTITALTPAMPDTSASRFTGQIKPIGSTHRMRPIEEIQEDIKWAQKAIRDKEYILALTRENLQNSCNGPQHAIFLRSCIAEYEDSLNEMDEKMQRLVAELQAVLPPPPPPPPTQTALAEQTAQVRLQ
jgi:outer membrane murein-binding lipoprotein Lpp